MTSSSDGLVTLITGARRGIGRVLALRLASMGPVALNDIAAGAEELEQVAGEVRAAGGRALVALVDVRPVLADSGARSVVEMRELGAMENVVIPSGVAHGFLALEPLALMYLVTNEYDGSDELGFAWDDPEVGIPWPLIPGTPDGKPILSDRDSSNPTLRQLVERLRD